MQDNQQELGDQLWKYLDARKNDRGEVPTASNDSSQNLSSDLAEMFMLSDVLFQELKSDQNSSDSHLEARKKLVESIRSERVVMIPGSNASIARRRIFPQLRWNRQVALLLVLLLLAAFAGGMATWNAYQNYCKSSAAEKHSEVLKRVNDSHCSLPTLPQKLRGVSESQHTMPADFQLGQTGHCSRTKERELNEGFTTNHSLASRSFNAAFTSIEPGTVRAGEFGLGYQRIGSGI